MDNKEFVRRYWRYYKMLEKRFIDSMEYVELNKTNFKTFSNAYALLVQAIGAELDAVFKEYCRLIGAPNAKNIDDYAKYILDNNPDIVYRKVIVYGSNMVIQPFEGWLRKDSKDSGSGKSLPWWTAFNKIKHNRYGESKEANLENAFNILGALFLTEVMCLREIGGEFVGYSRMLVLEDKYHDWLEAQKRGVKMYDYLVIGAGLYGAIAARTAKENGKSVLVIEKRDHVAGNIYTEKTEGINVHIYGAHIFHTNNKKVWDYITKFADFNRFINSPVANYKGELYSLPFNMYTFNKMWGCTTPDEAKAIIEKQKAEIKGEPRNLEEQAISLVGRDIFEKLIKGYTEKQWGRNCKDLPAFIIKRLPVRFAFDNNYFNALYQGIPIGGYTKLVENLLTGIEVQLNTDYLEHKADFHAKKVIYTGPIDAYFNYSLGALEYRSVRFETELLDIPNFQGNAAVNYTDRETPYTRIIEHKWFEFGKDENGNDLPKTVISREYSSEWKVGDEPYYPVNDEKNSRLYLKYKELADKERNVIFGGRLGEYKYYDMDQVIDAALTMCEKEF